MFAFKAEESFNCASCEYKLDDTNYLKSHVESKHRVVLI